MGENLRNAVATFAAQPRVLVAVDFNGTFAPFVTGPLQARALPGGLEAIRSRYPAMRLEHKPSAVPHTRGVEPLVAATAACDTCAGFILSSSGHVFLIFLRAVRREMTEAGLSSEFALVRSS